MSKRFSMVMVPTAMLLMALGLLIVEGSRRSVAASEAMPLSWRQVMGFFWGSAEDKGPGRTGGPRPGDYCLISPWDEQEVWSLQPVLLWKGSMQSAGIREAGTSVSPLHVSVQMVDGVRLAQASTPLQPGERYDWALYLREESSRHSTWTTFRVMDEERRAVVTTGLQMLEAELAGSGAAADEVAMNQAQYFLEQGLPFDALQVMFSVEEPSPELVESRQEMVERICNPPQEDDTEIDNEG